MDIFRIQAIQSGWSSILKTFHHYLSDRYQKWFYTTTALTLAGKELEKRAREIDMV
jgi:hypothetical protein